MQSTRSIAVAGATGRIGRQLVDVLGARGHRVVPIARASGVDLVSGRGLDPALDGVSTVVDVANGPTQDQQAATRFFGTAAANLHAAGVRAGVERMVAISIIGVDRFTAGYFAAKLAHERALLDGPVPVQILRAAQFHEFVATLLDWGRRGDVSYVPKMRTQLVAARTVAEVLADMATEPSTNTSSGAGSVAGRPREVAGPRAGWLADAARLLAARRGDPVRIEAVSNPEDPDRELYESGALLPGPDALLLGPTFEHWLTEAR